MKRKPGHANRWGAYICEPCSNGEHPGVNHVGLCQCTCDGQHDTHGNLISARPTNPEMRGYR